MKTPHTLLRYFVFFAFLTLVAGCQSEEQEEKKRPNILFAISDDQSFAHTGFGGKSWVNTPAFDRVASTGIYFKNCYAGSPGCAPSRSSIVTGRYHWQNESAGQHASGWLDKYVPFVDVLEKNGYATGRTAKGVSPFKYGEPFRIGDAAGKGFNEVRYEEGTEGDERYADGINSINYAENFKRFMEQKEEGKPFFFWYGATEPHRGFEKGSWKRFGKNPADVDVPAFLPDTDEVREDLLDYAVEIEWFDLHLQRMIQYLEDIGELENTIIIVTSDNGMAFPRAKANGYEYGVHVPMAVSFPQNFPTGRTIDDPISFIDLAPTILELTETPSEGMLPIVGKSFVNILESEKEGRVDETRKFAMAGRERHSSSRWRNLGYPQRIMRRNQYLYIWNMKPDRWPAGAPQRLVPEDSTGALYPMYGLDENGQFMNGTAFTDIDACPTLTFLVENHEEPDIAPFFEMAVGKRPEFEMFDVEKDPYCLQNLAGNPEFEGIRAEMHGIMLQTLTDTEDPRIVGPKKGVFDTYKRYSPMREFPRPEWAEGMDDEALFD